MVQSQTIVETAVGFIGGALLAAGLVLPWTQINPAYDGRIPAVYLAGMQDGIQWPDYILFGGTAATLLAILSQRHTTNANWVVVGTGGVALLVLGVNIASYLLSYWPVFVPALGAYLTIVGGLLLTGIGVIRLRVQRKYEVKSKLHHTNER